MNTGGYSPNDFNRSSPQGRNTDRLVRGGVKAGKNLTRKAGKIIEKTFAFLKKKLGLGGLIKLALIIAGIVILLLGLYSCSYFLTGEDAGQTGDYVTNDNDVSPARDKKASDASRTTSAADDNTLNERGAERTIYEMSPANYACLSYYTLLSDNKSCYQEYTDADGKISLIPMDDANAVKDAFGNDDNFKINPNLLYAMNKYLYQNEYVYPEAFLKPIAYKKENGKFKLMPLTDKNGRVKVNSVCYTEDGTKLDKKQKNVSAYGIASVISYKKEERKVVLKGRYTKEDYYDTSSGSVKTREINESFKIPLSSTTEHVISSAVTISGVITYKYKTDSVLSNACTDGTSSEPSDNVKKILYDTAVVEKYYANGPGGAVKYFNTEDELTDFCKEAVSFTPAKDTDGNYKLHEFSYNLYKYRSDDSGKYTDFVRYDKMDITNEDNTYLKDYISNFATYKPIIDRSNNFFRSIKSGGAIGDFETAELAGDGSNNVTLTQVEGQSGDNSNFIYMYNNDAEGRKTAETLWDAFIILGFTEEQTSAIIGNAFQESGLKADITNSIGAYGLFQWMGGRQEKLKIFAKDYAHKNASDVITQARFAAQELKGGSKWADDGWMHTGIYEGEYEQFCSSSNIETLTKVMCHAFERPGDDEAAYNNRVTAAKTAYRLFHGKKLSLKVSDVAMNDISYGNTTGEKLATDGSFGTTSPMTEEDKQSFYKFYHAGDEENIFDGKHKVELYTNSLTTEKVELIIKTANSFINGTTINDESMKTEKEMWDKDYLRSLAEEQSGRGSIQMGSVGNPSKKGFSSPVSTIIITDEFGQRDAPTAGASTYHQGMDLAVNMGDPIMAAAAGTVLEAGYSEGGGYYVEIDHGGGVVTVYFHNSKLCVTAGQKVKRGQIIARGGSTGISTGPHCHFGVLENGQYVNPRKYVNFSAN